MVFECSTCSSVEVLRTFFPDCCSVCGGSVCRMDHHDADDQPADLFEQGYGDPHAEVISGWMPSGDGATDARLAIAYQSLITLPTDTARLEWLERAVFSTDDFPAPDKPRDPYRAQLLRWWLEIYQPH